MVVLSDVEGRTALDWGVYGAPESFLVDGKGIVRWKHVGPLTDELIAKELLPLVATIEAER
ncbi:Thiol:disulfide interchange protein DsbE [bioreactor metagenome]|uniref:Thiol:disulfide interchange protein DsbE n=2 Tax=root TaxID=1 RepID=A0A645IJW0_9ZZZZ